MLPSIVGLFQRRINHRVDGAAGNEKLMDVRQGIVAAGDADRSGFHGNVTAVLVFVGGLDAVVAGAHGHFPIEDLHAVFAQNAVVVVSKWQRRGLP